jgi:transglutaminase-like putative cysteine protease
LLGRQLLEVFLQTMPSPFPDSMKFRVQCQLEYGLHSSATFFFAVRGVAAGGQIILAESLTTDPLVAFEEFDNVGGMNRIIRLQTVNPGRLVVRYVADFSNAVRLVPLATIGSDGPASLSPEAIPFLFPSRYCQSDRLRSLAQDLFGHLTNPYAVAAAVSDWVFENIAYVSGSSGETSSAMDTIECRSGVCRDFAHLCIAFCRALNVPARYVSCYANLLDPPDFHACFEAYVDGWWYVFDATRLAQLNGLIRIATGRDAADTAVCTIFGNPDLLLSSVSCFNLDADYIPMTRDALAARQEAIALL